MPFGLLSIFVMYIIFIICTTVTHILNHIIMYWHVGIRVHVNVVFKSLVYLLDYSGCFECVILLHIIVVPSVALQYIYTSFSLFVCFFFFLHRVFIVVCSLLLVYIFFFIIICIYMRSELYMCVQVWMAACLCC